MPRESPTEEFVGESKKAELLSISCPADVNHILHLSGYNQTEAEADTSHKQLDPSARHHKCTLLLFAVISAIWLHNWNKSGNELRLIGVSSQQNNQRLQFIWTYNKYLTVWLVNMPQFLLMLRSPVLSVKLFTHPPTMDLTHWFFNVVLPVCNLIKPAKKTHMQIRQLCSGHLVSHLSCFGGGQQLPHTSS